MSLQYKIACIMVMKEDTIIGGMVAKELNPSSLYNKVICNNCNKVVTNMLHDCFGFVTALFVQFYCIMDGGGGNQLIFFQLYQLIISRIQAHHARYLPNA